MVWYMLIVYLKVEKTLLLTFIQQGPLLHSFEIEDFSLSVSNFNFNQCILTIILPTSPLANLSNPSLISSRVITSLMSGSMFNLPCLYKLIKRGISLSGTQLPT